MWDYHSLLTANFSIRIDPELADHDALDLSMKRLIDLSINVETLTQARMNIHLAIGELLPSVSLPFGQGAEYSVSGLFRGLFGFILPQQWLRLKNSKLNYKLAKLSLLKASLDHYAQNRLTIYEIHRAMVRFEIQSFFFTHLELFSKNIQFPNPKDMDILQSISRGIATDMAKSGNMIGIRFNDLASLCNIFRDKKGHIASDSIRLGFIAGYTNPLPPPKDLGVPTIPRILRQRKPQTIT